MKIKGVLSAFILFLLAFLPACKDKDEDPDTIRIGMLLPVTGSGSSTGESCAVAMDLASEDIRLYFHTVGLDKKLDLYLEDTQTDTVLALQKIAKLHALGCHVMVGPYSSAEVHAIKDYCDQQGIVAISPSSVAISLAIPGDNIYRMAPDDRNQAKAVVELMKDDRKKHIVTLYRNDLWAQELAAATHDEFASAGGSNQTMIHYSTSTTDFSIPIGHVSDAVADLLVSHPAEECAVYLISFKEGTDILKRASQNEILNQVDWYGSSAYASNSTLPLEPSAATFAADHHLACPVFGFDEGLKDKWEPVMERMKTVLGRNPEIYALAVYDAIWLSVLTYLSLGDWQNIEQFKTALEFQCNNYVGTTGRTTLNEAGDRAYAIYDFWGIRLQQSEYFWSRVASYNNATGELKRY